MPICLLRASAALALLGAIAVSASAQDLTPVSSLPASTRPAGVPLDHVVTPHGFFHPSCVVAVAADETVLGSGNIARADGSERVVPACAYPSYDSAGRRMDSGDSATAYRGEVAYSDSDPTLPSPTKKFVSTVVVPSDPASISGQVLYFSTALRDAVAPQSTLEPVLAWNGFKAPGWTMSGWNCCLKGHIYHGPMLAGLTGDTLQGSMSGSGCSVTAGVCKTWKIVTANLNTHATTTLLTKSFGQSFNWYFGGLMAVAGVDTCYQYPANDQVSFTGLKITGLGTGVQTPAWLTTVVSGVPVCIYTVTTTPDSTLISFTLD